MIKEKLNIKRKDDLREHISIVEKEASFVMMDFTFFSGKFYIGTLKVL